MYLEKILDFGRIVSLRWRLTIVFVLIFGSTFIVFSIFIFNFLASTLQKEFDDALFNYAVDVAESVSLDASGDLSFQTPSLDKEKLYPFSLGNALIQIRHVQGEILTQVGNFGQLSLPYKKEASKLSQGEEVVYRTLSQLDELPNKEAEEYRQVTVAIDNSPTPQLLLQIAVPMSFLESQIESRRTVFQIAIPLVILLSIFSGYFISTRAFRPITDMMKKAHAIGAGRLSERLPVPKIKDELSLLASSINEMLSRIEQAFLSQDRFIADASHQLLSPLTIMKAELEAELRENRDRPAADIEFIKHNLQEVEHLSRIIQQLLLLARVEAGTGALNLQPVALDEIAMDAISRANRIALSKNIKLVFNIENQSEHDERPLVSGEHDLLTHLVFNLIENSVKYSPENSQIRIDLEWHKSHQILKVKDQGPGIPEELLPTIFDRFSRGKNTSNKAGYGLGLAIAKKIAEAHNGKLVVDANHKKLHDNNDYSGSVFSFEIKNI